MEELKLCYDEKENFRTLDWEKQKGHTARPLIIPYHFDSTYPIYTFWPSDLSKFLSLDRSQVTVSVFVRLNKLIKTMSDLQSHDIIMSDAWVRC